jgi:hypothetical protein
MNTLSRTVIFVLFLFSFFSAHAATVINQDIEVSTTWNKEGSPYIITNPVGVTAGATLTIEPGVVVKSPLYIFAQRGSSIPPSSIEILDGKIIAIGSESEPIYFTSIYDDSAGGDTDNYVYCYEPEDEDGNIIGPEICEELDRGDPFAESWGGVSFDNSTGSIFENVFVKYSQVTISSVSSLEIRNSSFTDCGSSACINIGDDEYLGTKQHVSISNSLFERSLGSGILIWPDSTTNVTIQNSTFNNFELFALENQSSSITVNAKENEWGSSSGPYHVTLNPEGQGESLYGLIDFDPWVGKDVDTSPEQYYAKIANIPSGVASLYDAPNTGATLVKTLPNDWVVKVVSKVGEDGGPMTSGGYRWYKVEDPTDKTLHYMISGIGAKSTYLPYDEAKQMEYENISVDNLSGTTTVQKNKRRQAVLDALDHYYNDTNTEKSLYSADDHTPDISILKKSNRISKEIILAIIAQEIGIVGFDNELVSYDYGHGIMQVTMDAYAHENPAQPKYFGVSKNVVDPRGQYSKTKVEICKLLNSDQYQNCYQNASTYNSKRKPYANYEHNTNNPKYKQYANTVQSIYANLKDGLAILSVKYLTALRVSCEDGNYTAEGYVFTCDDLVKIKTVWFYNGLSYSVKNNYMKEISEKLKTLSTYFPGILYNNSDNLIEKLEIANRHRVEIKAHSPIEISITDSSGNVVGIVDGEDVTTMSNAVYDAGTETAVIFFPDDDYTYKVVGDSTGGTYGLDIKNYNGSDVPVVFNAVDIPIVTSEVHTYTIDQEKLAEGESDAVTISVDKEGDGEVEKIVTTGTKLTDLEGPAIDVGKLLDEYVVGARLNTKDFVIDNKDKLKNIRISAQWNGTDIAVMNNKIPLTVYGRGVLAITATDSVGNTSTVTKEIRTTYAFKGFRTPVVGSVYMIQKSLPIRLRLSSLYKVPIPPQDPTLKIIKISDGSEVLSCLSHCFVSNTNLYTFLVPKNKLSEGEYRIDVSIEDNVYTTNVVMIK